MAEEDINMHMEDDELAPPEESGNRTFIIVAGALGAIMLATLICMGIYALVIAPNLSDRRATQVAEINAQNTQVAEAAQLTAEAASLDGDSDDHAHAGPGNGHAYPDRSGACAYRGGGDADRQLAYPNS